MYLLGLAIIVLCVIFYWYSSKKTGLESFPSPPTKFLFGHALDISTTTNFLKSCSKWTSEYGSTIRLRVLHYPCFLTIDPKLAEVILTNNKLLTKSINYAFLSNWLGSGLLTSTGNIWRKSRKILTPAFHFEILKEFVETFESVGNTLIEKLNQYDNSKSFDLLPIISLCTLDAICETAMGSKINAQKGENSNYVRCVNEMCRLTIERGLSGYKAPNWIYRLTPDYYEERKYLKVLHGFTSKVFKQKLEDSTDVGKKKMAFLDLMIKYSKQGEELSHDNIQNQVDTFMFAGHDTTSCGISYTLYCLANHPEVQNRVLEEQKALFGDNKNPTINYSDLQNMKFLEMVIKESMRLYPPVPFIGRLTDEALSFGKHTIPKNSNVGIYVYGMHRNPKYFPEPDKFNPDRFANFEKLKPFVYIPFSAGMRNCIGQKFAVLEMKSIISKIIRHFELLPAYPKHELELAAETVLTSTTGVHVGVIKRI